MIGWKSTASGILTALIGTFNALLAIQIPLVLLNPGMTRVWLWVTVGCNAGSIVGTIWLHWVTRFADAAAVAKALAPLTPVSVAPPTVASLAEAPKGKV